MQSKLVRMQIASTIKAGSTRSRTCLKLSSDLDLNIYTNEHVTRKQRADFRDILCDRLPMDTDGWTYVHMGKKRISLQRDKKRRETGGRRSFHELTLVM